MHTRSLFVAALVLGACLVPTEDRPLDAGTPDGGTGGGSGGTGDGGTGGGSGGFERCVNLHPYNERLCTTVYPIVCGGVTCATGQVCCETTGACVAPGATNCPNPPSTVYWIQNPTSCGSSADCQPGEYCVPDDVHVPGSMDTRRCIGASGHCESLDSCAYCGLPGSDRCLVCGCDGRTYASPQTACVAGVQAIHQGSCGVRSGLHDGGAYTIACGTNDQCPANAQCCFRTGLCFDRSEPWRCEVQPTGAVLDCGSHDECASGAGGGSGTETPRDYCAASTCGGPGLCSVRGSSGACGGEVQQVCGCDGVTYVNACWAKAAGARVAASGACP